MATSAIPVPTPTGAQAPYHSRIESLGLELPSQRRSMREVVDSCVHAPRIDLERLTGIRERRTCNEGEDSFSLAVDAASDCLAHSRYEPEELDMLLSCSIANYQGGLVFRVEPAFSFHIREAIGATHAMYFDVRNACAGMVTAIQILDDFIRRGEVRCGMVVSGEYITHIADNATRDVRTMASRQLASLTVGDSGAAVILERAGPDAAGISACELASYAEHSNLCFGFPCKSGPGAAMFTDVVALQKVAIEASYPTLQRALEISGIDFQDVDWVIPHQTSARAIRQGERHIGAKFGGLPKNVVYNLEEFGNTASTSHFVALYRLLEERRLRPGERILMLVFASGVVCGTMIFTMDELWEKYGNGD